MKLSQGDPFRNFNTYKINPITEIRNMGIITNGDVYWVSDTSDSDHTARTDAMGKDVVKTGPQAAIDAATADQNDYVMIIPKDDNGSWSMGTALDINKDRLHILSVGGQKAKNAYLPMIHAATGTSVDTEVVAVTGDGVEVGGLHFQGTVGTGAGGTVSNGNLYVNAHDFWGHDLYVEQKVDGWSESPCLTMGGTKHGIRFDDSRFSINGTGNVEAAAEGVIALGKAGKGQEFHNCFISSRIGSTAEPLIVSVAGATDFVLFENCIIANRDITHDSASAVIGSVDVDNPIILKDCAFIGVTDAGTDPTVFVTPAASGTLPSSYNPGIGVGTALVVAA